MSFQKVVTKDKRGYRNRSGDLSKQHRGKVVGIAFGRTEMNVVAIRHVAFSPVIIDTLSVQAEAENWFEAPAQPAFLEPLRDFVKRNRLRTREVVLSVPNSRVIVRYMEMPALPVAALRQMVRAELGTTIHLPFEDPVYDVASVAPLEVLGEEMGSVSLIAAPKAIVSAMIGIAQGAGLRPVAVDVDPIALWRFANSQDIDLSGMTILMHIQENAVTLSVFIDDMMYLLRDSEGMFYHTQGDANDVMRVCNDLVYELERIMSFFNMTLAKTEWNPQRVLLYSSVGTGDELSAQLTRRLNVPVIALRLGSNDHAVTSGSQRLDSPTVAVQFGLTDPLISHQAKHAGLVQLSGTELPQALIPAIGLALRERETS